MEWDRHLRRLQTQDRLRAAAKEALALARAAEPDAEREIAPLRTAALGVVAASGFGAGSTLIGLSALVVAQLPTIATGAGLLISVASGAATLALGGVLLAGGVAVCWGAWQVAKLADPEGTAAVEQKVGDVVGGLW